MKKSIDFRTGRHCVFAYTSIWTLQPNTAGAAHETLSDIFTKACQEFEAILVDTNGEDDHVPLLI
jgi:putative transposase